MSELRYLRNIISEIVKHESQRSVVIKECINVTEAPDRVSWTLSLTPRGSDGGNTENGFGFSQKLGGIPFDVSSSGMKGFVMKAVVQVHKSWAKPWEPERLPPFRPVDALVALKHGSAEVKGVTIVAQEGLQKLTAQFLAPKALRIIGERKVDIVITPESSSTLAAEFGAALASLLGAKFIMGGMVKQTDRATEAEPLPQSLLNDIAALKKFRKNLERFKSAPNSSLKKNFHASERDKVTKWFRPSDDFIDAIMDTEKEREPAPKGTKVVIVDDIITTGASFTEAARELERMGGFDVVAAIAMFKMQDSGH